MSSLRFRRIAGLAVAAFSCLVVATLGQQLPGAPKRPMGNSRLVCVVPNYHGVTCGWLTDFSTERNYCAYSYLDHLDRVRDDPEYCFGLSEVPNLMAILEFEPERFAELRRRIQEGRVELLNGFFLEPTINLSGGEALVKMGVEGLRWQQQVMGVRPRFAWMIDVTGVHEQMGQIVAGLGLDALVYTRSNPTASVLHWLESPDGTRVLAICPGGYSDWVELFKTKTALDDAGVRKLVADARAKARRTPPGAPLLVLGGSGDYSLAPAYKPYPTGFLAQWKQNAPNLELHFTGPGRYLDAVLPAIRAGKMELPTIAKRRPSVLAGILDPVPEGQACLSSRRTRASDGRSGGHRRQPEVWLQLPGSIALPCLAAIAVEYGPQHPLGRGVRSRLRASPLVGRARPLPVDRSDLRQSTERRFARRPRRRTTRGALQLAELETMRPVAP